MKNLPLLWYMNYYTSVPGICRKKSKPKTGTDGFVVYTDQKVQCPIMIYFNLTKQTKEERKSFGLRLLHNIHPSPSACWCCTCLLTHITTALPRQSPHLLQLHHYGHVLWRARHRIHTVRPTVHRPAGPDLLSSGWPLGSILAEAAAVRGARQRGEVRGEGVVRLQGGGSPPRGASQVRAGTEDHPGSGAARHPPGEEVRLRVPNPGWRWHGDRAVSSRTR